MTRCQVFGNSFRKSIPFHAVSGDSVFRFHVRFGTLYIMPVNGAVRKASVGCVFALKPAEQCRYDGLEEIFCSRVLERSFADEDALLKNHLEVPRGYDCRLFWLWRRAVRWFTGRGRKLSAWRSVMHFPEVTFQVNGAVEDDMGLGGAGGMWRWIVKIRRRTGWFPGGRHPAGGTPDGV